MSIWLYLTEVLLLSYHEQGEVKDLEGKKLFLTAPVDFLIPIVFSNLNYNCSIFWSEKSPGAS